MHKFLVPRVRASLRRNNIDQSYVYVDNFWENCRCLILILVKKAEKRKANDEPTDPEKIAF
jgi:hypothetical protein